MKNSTQDQLREQMQVEETSPNLSGAPNPSEMEFNRKINNDMALLQIKGSIIDVKRLKFDTMVNMKKVLSEHNIKLSEEENERVTKEAKDLLMSLLELKA